MADNFADYLFDTVGKRDKIFSLSKESQLTYGNLKKKVKKNSHILKNIFSTKQLIAICIPNSTDFIVNYLSIIKSGHAAVVLDTGQAVQEQVSLIKKYNISALVSNKTLLKKFEKFSSKNFLLLDEKCLDKIKLQKQIKQRNDLHPSLALVLFSSGSTGKKKGVMLSHRNLIANTHSIINYLKINDLDRMNVVLPFSYSYGLSLLHTHLKAGGSLYLHSSPFIGSVIHEMNEYQCTGFAGVPSTFITLLNKTPFFDTSYNSLRYMTQAGGKLPTNYVKIILKKLKKIEFFIMYGATEGSPRLSYLPPKKAYTKPNSIGIPIPGVKLEIIKPKDKNRNMEIEGEIVASGDNIMIGYLDNPIATSKVLKNGKLYTGDLGMVDDDGYFYYLGRKNRVVKSMGYRVSLDSIEKKILSMSIVNNVCVIQIDHELYGNSLGAIIQPKEKIRKEILKKILDQFFSKNLTSYETPDPYIIADSIPKNSSGKIDFNFIKKMLNDPRKSI